MYKLNTVKNKYKSHEEKRQIGEDKKGEACQGQTGNEEGTVSTLRMGIIRCNKNLHNFHVNTASNGSAFHVNAGNSAVSQSMDGRGFPINISVQICTHPDRSKTVRRNPERLRMSSTAVIPYLCTNIQSREEDATCLLHVCWAFNVSIIFFAGKTVLDVQSRHSSTRRWDVRWERAAGPRCSRLDQPVRMKEKQGI